MRRRLLRVVSAVVLLFSLSRFTMKTGGVRNINRASDDFDKGTLEIGRSSAVAVPSALRTTCIAYLLSALRAWRDRKFLERERERAKERGMGNMHGTVTRRSLAEENEFQLYE